MEDQFNSSFIATAACDVFTKVITEAGCCFSDSSFNGQGKLGATFHGLKWCNSWCEELYGYFCPPYIQHHQKESCSLFRTKANMHMDACIINCCCQSVLSAIFLQVWRTSQCGVSDVVGFKMWIIALLFCEMFAIYVKNYSSKAAWASFKLGSGVIKKPDDKSHVNRCSQLFLFECLSNF